MKKIYLLPAVIAALALVSCETEPQFDNGNGLDLSKDGIAFVFGGGRSTKSADVKFAPKETGMVFSVGQESGSEFYLEETVEDLNGCGPETKGTPIYTKNVSKFYNTFGAVTYIEGQDWDDDPYLENVDFESLDEKATVDSREGWIYNHYYATSPWPKGADKNKNLYFYLRMPTDHLDGGASYDYTYGADGSIEFGYSAPRMAQDQRDILFAFRTLNQDEYMQNYRTTGAPVTFYHALTGIKFRSANNNTNATKTVITKVEFIGLKGSGKCTVEEDGTVTWEDQADAPYSFYQDFANPKYDKTLTDPSENPDGTYEFGSDDKNFGSTTFVTGKNADKQNLNDSLATQTFWLVPQDFAELSEDEAKKIQLKVTFRVKTPDTPNGTEITHTIKDFGEQLRAASVNWQPGQLRTYTLEPIDVDVEIFDKMVGYNKDSLHVTNTGNVDEYVRMLVIGNWYGWETQEDFDSYEATGKPEPEILVGYKYAGDETGLPAGTDIDEMADPWFRGDDKWGSYFDDSFKKGNPSGTDWVKAKGGYYYTKKIGPGQTMGDEEDVSSMTQPLFEHYWLPEAEVPTIYVPVHDSNVRQAAIGVHLIMEVVIQAIGVPKDDNGNEVGWQQAWYDATGIPELNPNPTNP